MSVSIIHVALDLLLSLTTRLLLLLLRVPLKLRLIIRRCISTSQRHRMPHASRRSADHITPDTITLLALKHLYANVKHRFERGKELIAKLLVAPKGCYALA